MCTPGVFPTPMWIMRCFAIHMSSQDFLSTLVSVFLLRKCNSSTVDYVLFFIYYHIDVMDFRNLYSLWEVVRCRTRCRTTPRAQPLSLGIPSGIRQGFSLRLYFDIFVYAGRVGVPPPAFSPRVSCSPLWVGCHLLHSESSVCRTIFQVCFVVYLWTLWGVFPCYQDCIRSAGLVHVIHRPYL